MQLLCAIFYSSLYKRLGNAGMLLFMGVLELVSFLNILGE